MNTSPYALPGIKTETIEDIAAEVWGINKELLPIKTRKQEVVEARHVLMDYRRNVMKQTLYLTASYYNKDHASVLHSKKRVKEFNKTDKEFRRKYDEFYQLIETRNIKRS